MSSDPVSGLHPENPSANWSVYILLCSDHSLYTGISTDIERRFRQHLAGRGARYFRGRQPLRIVYSENGHSRSSASRREAEIKSLSRAGKDVLVSQSGRHCGIAIPAAELDSVTD